MSIDINIFLNSIVHDISDGIYILDTEMKIIFMNNVAKKIMGIPLNDEKFIGMHWQNFIKKILGSYSNFSYTPFRKEPDKTHYEVKIQIPDGSSTYLKQTNKQIWDDQGKLLGVVAIMKDVAEVARIERNLPDTDRFGKIIGKNHRMLNMYDSIKQVALTDATVLILGETGTGKEYVTDAIHALSKRKDGPLIKVNCSALSESILESELFGHVKGSFTGALYDRKGKFELADKGTIFLDEIGELDQKIQIKLLRVLQEKEIEKVGGSKTNKVDVRVIAATNKDIRKEVKEGRFREDLYYRINIFPITVPPLRERLDDIDLLCQHFINKHTKAHKKEVQLSQEVIDLFRRYSWPGNVRELEHVLEYAFIKSKKKVITFSDIPEELFENEETITIQQAYIPANDGGLTYQILREALNRCGWNKTRAAQKLGISRTTMWRLIKKFNIKEPLLLPYDDKSSTKSLVLKKEN